MNLKEHPHRRYNPLTEEWVKVSPHRTKRPWQGQVEKAMITRGPKYDEKCYLCPGNSRSGGHKNPKYSDTFVFDNDFATLLPDTPPGEYIDGELFQAKSERGLCKVICFSPRHDLTLALMETKDIESVIRVWKKEYKEIGENSFINHVQIFENRGAVMGCSNPHPHGQIWAEELVPVIPAAETKYQKKYFEKHESPLLIDYLKSELEKKERIVFENNSFAVVVPWWAVWPYEVMLLPKNHHPSLLTLSEKEILDLADAVKRLGIRYDNLFKTSFAYSMGIHQQPTDGENHPEWQFHFHYYPPLLRSATVKKFMVGYEMMAMPQRDITAESSAASLRNLGDVHYSQES